MVKLKLYHLKRQNFLSSHTPCCPQIILLFFIQGSSVVRQLGHQSSSAVAKCRGNFKLLIRINEHFRERQLHKKLEWDLVQILRRPPQAPTTCYVYFPLQGISLCHAWTYILHLFMYGVCLLICAIHCNHHKFIKLSVLDDAPSAATTQEGSDPQKVPEIPHS